MVKVQSDRMKACVLREEEAAVPQRQPSPSAPRMAARLCLLPSAKISLSAPHEASFALDDLHVEVRPPLLHEVNIYSTVNGMLLSLLRFPTSYWGTSQRQVLFFFPE